MTLTLSPWNLIRSMKSIDSWGNTVNSNIIGSTRVGFKQNEINFGRNTTQVVRPPTTLTAGTQIAEQQISVDNTKVNFRQGDLVVSDSETHFAIKGDGFFLVQKLKGSDLAGATGSSTIVGTLNGAAGSRAAQKETFMTRNGQFHWGTLEGDPNNNVILLNDQGYAVLSDHGDSNNFYGPIGLTDWNNQVVGPTYKVRPSIIQTTEQLHDFRFSNNDSTLFQIDGNANVTTLVEGANDRLEAANAILEQYFLEASNVNVDQQAVQLSASEKYFEMLTKQFTVYLGNIDSSLSLFK